MARNKSIEFIDLFDWESESDRHYMSMLQGPYYDEIVEEEQQPAIIIVKSDDNKTIKRTFTGANKKGVQS